MDNQNQNTPDLSGMLSGLLSNPQALSAISSLLGNLNRPPSQSQATPASAQESPPKFEEAKPSDAPAQSIPVGINAPSYGLPFSPIHTKKDDRGRALLIALKPFLSKSKCDTVDLFIRMLDLISLLGKVR